MAEFPHLGEHCGVDLCNQLDFLPVKCNACNGTFCSTHFKYEAHNCSNSHSKDVRVPVCPVCNQAIDVPKGVSADLVVNAHIEQQCPVAKKKRIYQNKCTKIGCKKRELVPMLCRECGKNFCIAHRHETDHDCQPVRNNATKPTKFARPPPPVQRAGLAALQRDAQSCSRQAQLTEDEALARALASSMTTQSPEDLDAQLARQLQEEEYGLGLSSSNKSKATRVDTKN